MGLPFKVVVVEAGPGRLRCRRPLSKKEKEARAARLKQMWEASLIEDARIDAHFNLLRELISIPSYGVRASTEAIAGLCMPPPAPPTTDCSSSPEKGGRCAICLEDLDVRRYPHKLRMMPCHHCFHQHCINNWLLINRLCPVCQFAFPSEEDQRVMDDEQAAARGQQDIYGRPDGGDAGSQPLI